MATAIRELDRVREERAVYSTRATRRPVDIFVKGGLSQAKHCRAMGPALWLYQYLLSRAGFETGRVDRYVHAEAVKQLGMSERTIRSWMDRLVKHGYLIVTQHNYYLTIDITKFTPQSVRLAERRSPAKPPETPCNSPAESCRSTPDRVAESCQSHGDRVAESCKQGGRNLPSVRSNVPNVPGSRDRSRQKDLGSRQKTPTAPPLISPDADLPESAKPLHDLLKDSPGYNLTVRHLAKLAGDFPTLDLEIEALKILDWLARPKNQGRQCSFTFVANWLKRADADQPTPVNGAVMAPRPPDIEDGETYYRRLLETGNRD